MDRGWMKKIKHNLNTHKKVLQRAYLFNIKLLPLVEDQNRIKSWVIPSSGKNS